MTVGKIGGRRLPLVAADLLKYRLGARRYTGQIAQLVRSEPPAPAHPVRSGPGPLSLMAKRGQIPYPLPEVEGELCDLRMTSLGWTPGAVSGVIESECTAAVEEAISLQTVAGHQSVTETALLDAEVTAITVTVAAQPSDRTSACSRTVSVAFSCLSDG